MSTKTKTKKVVRWIYGLAFVMVALAVTLVGVRYYQLNTAIAAIENYGGSAECSIPKWLPDRFDGSAIPFLHGPFRIDLSDCSIDDDDMPDIVDQINQLGEPQYISLAATGITDDGLKEFQRIDRFRNNPRPPQIIDPLDGTKYTFDVLALSHLDLSGTRVTDAGLAHLSHLSSLRWLSLMETKITDDGLRQIAKLHRLEVLNLVGTNISDGGMVHLESLGRLESLGISNTRVTDDGLRHIAKLHSLEGLNLDGTNVSDSGMEHLESLSRLEYLSISNTQVTEAGVSQLAEKLPKLDVYDD